MKGVTLVQGSVVVLSIDGSLVYVETVEPSFAAVVALPEQPTDRTESPVFTPGKVGVKKISPFSVAAKTVAIADLSERNKNFIGTYEQARTQHGPHYINDDQLRAEADAKANAPDPKVLKEQAKAAKAAAREQRKADKAKQKGGPRYLQRCTVCGEQQGHPNHPDQHAFEAPAAPAPVPVVCAACDKPEADHDNNALNHRFIPTGRVKQPRAPKEPREPKAPREPREPKVRTPRADKPAAVPPTQKYRYVHDDAKLQMLCAVNGKYNPGNSGAAVIGVIKGAGDAGASILEVVGQPKCPSTPERAELAFQQLLGAKLIEAVS